MYAVFSYFRYAVSNRSLKDIVAERGLFQVLSRSL
jgi:transposase-like protein